MTDPIKAKIQELCPDVMELKEGCEVTAGIHALRHTIYGYDDDERVFMAYLNKPFPKDLLANSFYDCQFGIGAENVEILGSPITLAVVLRAIRTKQAGIAVSECGEFMRNIPVQAYNRRNFLAGVRQGSQLVHAYVYSAR